MTFNNPKICLFICINNKQYNKCYKLCINILTKWLYIYKWMEWEEQWEHKTTLGACIQDNQLGSQWDNNRSRSQTPLRESTAVCCRNNNNNIKNNKTNNNHKDNKLFYIFSLRCSKIFSFCMFSNSPLHLHNLLSVLCSLFAFPICLCIRLFLSSLFSLSHFHPHSLCSMSFFTYWCVACPC